MELKEYIGKRVVYNGRNGVVKDFHIPSNSIKVRFDDTGTQGFDIGDYNFYKDDSGIFTITDKASNFQENLSCKNTNDEYDMRALLDEQSNVYNCYCVLEKLYSEANSKLPYPDIDQCTTSNDYDELERIQYRKSQNAPFWDKMEKYQKYGKVLDLCCGHIIFQGAEHFLTDNGTLVTDRFGSFHLINVDDANYKGVISGWRFPDEYGENVSLSRNIQMENKEVIAVATQKDVDGNLQKQTDREFVADILKKNKENVATNSIISTIEQKQNLVRTLDKNTQLVVQGCAGSGKTMVLLHRIRYLAYNDNNDEFKNNYIFLVPGEKYKNFISPICENFGILDDKIFTLTKFYCSVAGNKVGVSEKNELVCGVEFLKYVYSEELITETYKEMVYPKVRIVDELLRVTRKELVNPRCGWDYRSEMYRIIRNIEHLRDSHEWSDNIKSLKPCRQWLRNYINAINSLFKLGTRNEVLHRRLIAINSVFKLGSTTQIVDDIAYEFFENCCEKISRRFDGRLDKGYKCYWYLRAMSAYLFGECDNQKFRYIFIDEAQDLSVMELDLIQKINIEGKFNPVMNIFGDVNQVITEHGISSWLKWKEDFRYYSFHDNYRNTNQIIEFCNSQTLSGGEMRNVGVDMEPVQEFENLADVLNNERNLSKHFDFIVKDEKVLDSVSRILDMYLSSVMVYTVGDVKGLEFKETYVIDVNMSSIEKYIAYTRPLVKLNVIHSSSVGILSESVMKNISNIENYSTNVFLPTKFNFNQVHIGDRIIHKRHGKGKIRGINRPTQQFFVIFDSGVQGSYKYPKDLDSHIIDFVDSNFY